jgi:subtilase family serine protease
MRFALSLSGVALLFVIAPAVSRAQAPDRIAGVVDNSQRIPLPGSVHPSAQPAYDRGRVDAAMSLPRVVMAFKPSAAQQADLDTLLAEQQDRSSPNYHRWLTPEEFGSRFGLSQTDLAKVVAWLESQGLGVVQVARSRTRIAFGGSAAQVEAAFQIELHHYNVNGEAHYANASPPSLPAAFVGMVAGFRGLDDFRPVAHAIVKSKFTSSISGNHFIVPDDFARIYDLKPLYAAGVDGTGQKVAVMGQTDVAVSNGTLTDIQTFRSLSGLPTNNPQIVLVPGSQDPGMLASDIDEANIDLEWSGAVARNATIVYVNSTDVFGSFQYAIDQNLAPVISISYGGCEAQEASAATFLQSLGQQANAEGITIVAPTGDKGAAGCDTGMISTQGLAVDMPASLPSVTAVGGTEFNDCSGTYWSATNNSDNGSVLSYIPEVAWNDTDSTPGVPCGFGAGQLSAGGGGASMLFPKPAWQVGAGVPNDGQRDVPDVAIAASADHDGYLICTESNSSGSFTPTCVNEYREANNGLSVFGGTSMGVPTFAGMVALINQQTGSQQGNVNYTLYALAAVSTDAFHDITSGNNIVPCQNGTPNCSGGTLGFSAGPGYDLATGLGSVDANNLVYEWTSVSPRAAPSITSLSPTSGAVGTPVTIAGTNFGATQGRSTVMFNKTAATPTSWSTASIVTPVPEGATTGSVEVTVGGVASNGMNFTVTSTATFSISSANSSFANAVVIGAPGGSGSSTVTVTSLNSFAGIVTLTCAVAPSGGTDVPTCNFPGGNSVTLAANGTQTPTVMLSTTAAASLLPKSTPIGHPGPMGLLSTTRSSLAWVFASILAVLAVLFLARVPERRWGYAGLVVLLPLVTIAAVACGSSRGGTSNPGTTTGIYIVTVSGTSGTTTGTPASVFFNLQ